MYVSVRQKIFLVLVLASCWGALAVSQSRPPLLLEDARADWAPFEQGETLKYEVHWKPVFFFPAFKAGEIKLEVTDSELEGAPTYRLRAWAHSAGTLSRVAGVEVRNYFESEIDRRDFRSYRNLQKIRQGERQRDVELIFDYGADETVVRETDPSKDPPRVLRDEVEGGIPAPVIDILSALYVTRLRIMEPGQQFLMHLNEKGDFREVTVAAEEKESVKTPIGRFESIRLATRGGLFKDGGELSIWYSTDRTRIPTKFEANVKLGKIYGSLIGIDRPSLNRSVIETK